MRNFGPLVAPLGASCGSFWCVLGPLRALVGLCLGSILLYFGALVAFGVYFLRVVVDLLVMQVEQRLSEAFRKLLAAISEAKNFQQP